MQTKLILLGCLLSLIFSCNKIKEEKAELTINTAKAESFSLKGTWERLSYYNYVDGKVQDTFITTDDNRHIKVFTDSKVMWCRFIPSDSSDWFGYGSYSIKGNTLTEVLDYGSKTMSVHIANDSAFVFNLDLSKDYLSLVKIDEEGHPVFAENYHRIE